MTMKPLKAYVAYEKDGEGSTIVFAENRTQAKLLAMATDCCGDARYIDIRVNRVPAADTMYDGHREIDWYNQRARVVLVRDFGWSCLEPSWECDTCKAKPYCRWHEEEAET